MLLFALRCALQTYPGLRCAYLDGFEDAIAGADVASPCSFLMQKHVDAPFAVVTFAVGTVRLPLGGAFAVGS